MWKEPTAHKAQEKFLTANIRRVVDISFFLLGDSPESEFYVPKFMNTLSVPSS
jgi:hypothetical protein